MKSNKGSVTLYVIIAMLTISAFLMAIYIRNANAERVQEQVTAKIKSTYENYNFTEAYETIKNSKPEIKGYSIKDDKLTIETYTSNGINVDQNGKKILYYAVTTSETSPTDTEWQNINGIDISSIEDGTSIYLWIKNENNIVSNEYKIVLEIPAVLISFTIGETTYQAEEGMTWEKWCDSSYNTDGFYYNISGGSIRVIIDEIIYTIENGSNKSAITDENIIANTTYSLEMEGPA